MKTSLILLFLILGYTISLAQDNGYLTSNQAKPKVNLANTYSYVPPPKLILADTLEALVTYKNKEAFTSEYITLVKQATKYTFSFKAPGSTAVLLIAIVDAKVDFSEYSPFFSINFAIGESSLVASRNSSFTPPSLKNEVRTPSDSTISIL